MGVDFSGIYRWALVAPPILAGLVPVSAGQLGLSSPGWGSCSSSRTWDNHTLPSSFWAHEAGQGVVF